VLAEAPPDTAQFSGGTLVVPQPSRRDAIQRTVEHAPATPSVPLDSDRLPAVARVSTLRHRPACTNDLTAAEFVEMVVATARDEAEPPASVAADGTRSCRFLCSTPAPQLPRKLAEVAKQFGMSVETPELGLVVLRRTVSGPALRGGLRAEGELWVTVRRAEVGPETSAAAGLQGDLSEAARQAPLRAVPGVLSAVRGALENFRERRAHPRYPAGFSARIHPVGPDGSIGPAEDGLCEDVSAGGVLILTRAAVPWEQMYLEFRSIEGIAGNALLASATRSARGAGGHLTVCQFRV
jgi:hypothetical protein